MLGFSGEDARDKVVVLLGRRDDEHGIAGLEPVEVARAQQPAVAHGADQART